MSAASPTARASPRSRALAEEELHLRAQLVVADRLGVIERAIEEGQRAIVLPAGRAHLGEVDVDRRGAARIGELGEATARRAQVTQRLLRLAGVSVPAPQLGFHARALGVGQSLPQTLGQLAQVPRHYTFILSELARRWQDQFSRSSTKGKSHADRALRCRCVRRRVLRTGGSRLSRVRAIAVTRRCPARCVRQDRSVRGQPGSGAAVRVWSFTSKRGSFSMSSRNIRVISPPIAMSSSSLISLRTFGKSDLSSSSRA